MKKLSKNEMKKIMGGELMAGRLCVGNCWTGDKIGQTYPCGQFLFLECSCKSDALGGNCRIVEV